MEETRVNPTLYLHVGHQNYITANMLMQVFMLYKQHSPEFYDRMTVHCNRFLVNETNKRTELQFYWYYNSTCFRQLQLWWPFAGNKWSSQLHKMYQSQCTAKNSWWRAERLPETCRVIIPIKLEFSASVGFIHKHLPIQQLCYSPFIFMKCLY
jgi:hypothetical protein